MTYTEECQELSKALDIELSVAMDIVLLRNYEKRIIAAAKANPNLRDFPVFNDELDRFLESFES